MNSENIRQGFLKQKNDLERIELHSSVFKKIRDKIVFHIDPDVIPGILEIYNIDYIDSQTDYFASGHTDEKGDLYYNLTDELVFLYLINSS